jgi:hypothetical protein
VNKFFLLIIATVLVSATSVAQTTTYVKPKGIYAEIDVAGSNKAIENLSGENKTLQQQTLDSILSSPNSYNPPVLYALSRVLYNQDKKDEAAFWFYVAQLRARYDANLCLDNSAKDAVSILNNEYGPDINKYAFQNIDSLEKTVIKVVDYVRNNEENYDHRWINLHGMDAFLDAKSKKISEPKGKWPAIKKKTIDDYYNGFIEYVKNKKK